MAFNKFLEKYKETINKHQQIRQAHKKFYIIWLELFFDHLKKNSILNNNSSKKEKISKILSVITSFIFTFFISLIAYMGFLFDKSDSVSGHLTFLLVPIFIFNSLYLFFTRKYRKRKKIISRPFSRNWEEILKKNVRFFSSLNKNNQKRFKRNIQIFLGEKKITGIDTNVDDMCRILVAASAVIPVFGFHDWDYENLGEILVYPSNFNENFSTEGKGRNVLGMVVPQSSALIISKPALYDGFEKNNRMNVGIHEFIHKIDERDGSIDGVPALIINQNTAKDWLRIMEKESLEIKKGRSDLNSYALTNPAEFFAVASEYFFDNPVRMSEKHPELYVIMKKIFKQDVASGFKSVFGSMFLSTSNMIRKNSPCPCGSGKKYKKCCRKKRRKNS